MSSRVLVTGGAGYIGSHVAKALARAGHFPVVYDDLSSGHREAVRWGPLYLGDVRDSEALAQCMAQQNVSAVIHLAGLADARASVDAPGPTWDCNFNGVGAVLAAMREVDVQRIVFSSSAAVYGHGQQKRVLAVREDGPTSPESPYGDSKLAAERLIALAAREQGLQGVALRYFNAAGADPDGDIGEARSPETHLIPLAIEAALGITGPLTVFGDDFATRDGSCVRDYIHVADLARAHLLALQVDAGADRFIAINLGLGQGHTVFEVIEAVGRVTGSYTPYVLSCRRDGDPAILVADPARAKALLGWEPRFTQLEDIVATAVQWRRAPRFGFRTPTSVDDFEPAEP